MLTYTQRRTLCAMADTGATLNRIGLSWWYMYSNRDAVRFDEKCEWKAHRATVDALVSAGMLNVESCTDERAHGVCTHIAVLTDKGRDQAAKDATDPDIDWRSSGH